MKQWWICLVTSGSPFTLQGACKASKDYPSCLERPAWTTKGFTCDQAKIRVNTCGVFTCIYAKNYIFILLQPFHNPSTCMSHVSHHQDPAPALPARPCLFPLWVKTAGCKHRSPGKLESHLKVASDLGESWTLAAAAEAWKCIAALGQPSVLI